MRQLTHFQFLFVNSVNTSDRKDLIFADFTCIGHTNLPSKFEVFAVSTKIIRVVATLKDEKHQLTL